MEASGEEGIRIFRIWKIFRSRKNYENKLERIDNIIEKLFVLPSRKVDVDKNKKEYDWQGATG